MGDRDDRGAITVFVVMFASVVFMMVGLVYEGGQHLAAQREARNAASAAARAGAQAIDEASIRAGGNYNVLDQGEAQQRICEYLNNVESNGNITCGSADVAFSGGGTRITVEVSQPVEVRILPGLSTTATGEGTACAEFGVSGSMGLCD